MQNRTVVFANVGIGIAASLLAVVLLLELKSRLTETGGGEVVTNSRDAPVRVEESWEQAVSLGVDVGGTENAIVTIVELTDLECSACKSYQATLDSLLVSRAGSVRLLYVPLPLERLHRFAMPAARAAECAASAGRLVPWMRAMFQYQDSLGLKSWGSLAALAGFADTVEVASCARSGDTPPRVRDGISLAQDLGVMATPTILINGWRYPNPPNIATLEKFVDAARAGPNHAAFED